MKVPPLNTQVNSDSDIVMCFQTLSLHPQVSSDPDVSVYSQAPPLPPRGFSDSNSFEPFHPLSVEIRLRARARYLVNCIVRGTTRLNPFFWSLMNDDVFCFSRKLLNESQKGAGLYNQIKDLDFHELALMVALLCVNSTLPSSPDIASALGLLIATINIREETVAHSFDRGPLALSTKSTLVIEQVLQLVHWTTVPIVILFYYEHEPSWLGELLDIFRNAAQSQTLYQATVIETGLWQSMRQTREGHDHQYNSAWLVELLGILMKILQTHTLCQVDTSKIDLWQLFYLAPFMVGSTLAPRMWHMLSSICYYQHFAR